MIAPRDRGRFLQELVVAEVLARRGEGPLARKRWPAPPPRERTAADRTEGERAAEAERSTPEPGR